MIMSRIWVLALCNCLLTLSSFAQESGVELCRQHSFHTTIPAGNYSGITWLGNNQYAVVNDKASESGFHLFTIDIDSITGDILHASENGFRSSGKANRDDEGICFFPKDSTLWISGETDNEVLEYAMSGALTGRRLQMPTVFKNAKKNMGLEALTYQRQTGLFYTIPENPLRGDSLLRLQSFGNDLQPFCHWYYRMDGKTPEVREGKHTIGVPALAAMADGRLLVLEREVFKPTKNIGSYVYNKVYVVTPLKEMEGRLLEKRLLVSFKTKINLTARSFANYEGMCLGPCLADGRQVVVLISDSQNQYKGFLKDWLRTIVLP